MTSARLKHLVRINERSLPDTTDSSFEFGYLDIGSVGRGILLDKPEQLTFGDAPSRARRLVQAGDTIISTVRTYLRAVWPVQEPTSDLVVSTGFAVLTPGSLLDHRYLGWLAQSDVVVEEIVARSVGVSYPAINALDIGEVRVPLVHLRTQRAVADFLDIETARIDALIARKRKLIDLLDERLESAVFFAVTHGRREQPLKPSGLSWVPEIPQSWETPSVSVHFELQLGKMLNAAATQGPEPHPYVRNVNIQWDRFELDDLAEMHFSKQDRRRCALRKGDLLVCEGGEVGRAAVWPGEPTNCYFQKAIHRVRPRGGANSRFLMYCLRAAAKRDVFAVEGNLSTIIHLTGEQLRAYRFPWPSENEQADIVDYLDASAARARSTQGALGRQIEHLQARRQALITAAVTAELDIPGISAA